MAQHDGEEPMITAEPVPGYGKFTWKTGRWQQIFDRQIELIQGEIARAQAEDRMVIYLSCPISSRGGGYSRTNVEIASYTARRLMHEWGDRYFVVSPVAYQLESREGTGLILDHIKVLFAPSDPEAFLKELLQVHQPGGSDYMRMWSRVLIEDRYYRDLIGTTKPRKDLNCGGLFDGFYFLGPTDVRSFFGGHRETGSSVVEQYFARKHATDPDFRRDFDYETKSGAPVVLDLLQPAQSDAWESRRKRFVRYYTLFAGANYSLGSRDEWNIMVRINRKRTASPSYGPGEEISAYFDGRQVNASASIQEVERGYEVVPQSTPRDHPGEVSWPVRSATGA